MMLGTGHKVGGGGGRGGLWKFEGGPLFFNMPKRVQAQEK